MKNVFGKKLRELRKAFKLSQRELGERLGISQSAIAAYENGKKAPTISVVVKIAKFFNVSTDYLLGLTDDPSPRTGELPEVIRKKLEQCEKPERYEKLEQFLSILKELIDNL